MPRVDPQLITFLVDTNDLETIWDATFNRLTPYFAINTRSKSDQEWYLLTWRDMLRSVRFLDAEFLDTERPKVEIVPGNVIRYGRRLAVNQPDRPSVLLDGDGKPEGVAMVDPFAHFLAVHGPKLSGWVEPGAPKRRTRSGGFVRPPGDKARRPNAQVTRTPHMGLAPDVGTIAVGTTIDVTVYADTRPQAEDEQSESISLSSDGPIDLDVRLETSAHFDVVGLTVQPLTIDPNRDSTERLAFKVTALRCTAAGEAACITAYFSHAMRPCGLVRRLLSIPARAGSVTRMSSLPTASDVAPEPQSTGRIDVRAGIDSDVLVIVRNPSGDLKNFRVEVHTGLVPSSEYNAGPVDWTFGDVTAEIVHGMFKRFEAEGQSRGQRYAHLVGAGWELWDKAPRNFVDLFWTLIDQRKPLKTIAIVSEEPYIPWELMEPTRYMDSLPEVRDVPLGVEFTVARWTTNDMITAPQSLPLSQSRIVAPRYKDPLEHAEQEVAMVLKQVPGERIDPADFAALDANLGVAKASLLHFVCHGVANMKDDEGERLVGVQAIQLEGTGQALDSRSIKGLKSFRTFFRQRPLVVLNACEAGRPSPALSGVGGLASSFIDLGAAGVIAPLWSVDDEIAYKVATALYEALSLKPAPTFAEIMRSVRARAYVGDEFGTDSYAAYCFYGDPLARPE